MCLLKLLSYMFKENCGDTGRPCTGGPTLPGQEHGSSTRVQGQAGGGRPPKVPPDAVRDSLPHPTGVQAAWSPCCKDPSVCNQTSPPSPSRPVPSRTTPGIAGKPCSPPVFLPPWPPQLHPGSRMVTPEQHKGVNSSPDPCPQAACPQGGLGRAWGVLPATLGTPYSPQGPGSAGSSVPA